ncbi:MAG: transporter substrate-binding domain-containing protein [Algicola sp.]|nr:transporter substrate-binding domain-containing protein [Algicola sp.]
MLVLMVLSFTSTLQAQETKKTKEAKELIKVAAIDWCPQICPKSTENPGYLVQLISDLFAKSGFTLKFEIMSWSDAINSVEAGHSDILLSPSKDEAPGLVYHRDPLAIQTHCFWKLADSDWKFKDITSLKNNSIVIYRDHSYGTLLREYLSDNYKKYVFELMYDTSYLQRAHRLLQTGRASAFLFTTNSVLHFKKTNNISTLKMGSCIKKDHLWVGMSPKNQQKINRIKAYIDANLLPYKDTTKHKILLRKYNILTPEIDQIK